MGTTSEKSEQKQDWFEDGLMKRLPSDVQGSFSQAQLDALKVAFGARKWGRHPVDVRGTINIWTWRYYFVFLMGRNRRELSRTEKQISLFLKTILIFTFLLFSTLLGLLVIYLLKSAAGIDLFPGFSLGIWGWFKGLFL